MSEPLVAPLLGTTYGRAVRGALAEAVCEVRVAMFLVNLTVTQDLQLRARSLVESLSEAAWRGVDVRVLLAEPGGLAQRRSTVVSARFLRRRGIDVRMLEQQPHHVKLVVVDLDTVLIGSHNWTPSALGGSLEASILVRDTETSRECAELFDRWWSSARVVADATDLGR